MVGRKSISPPGTVDAQSAKDALLPPYSDSNADQVTIPQPYLTSTTTTTVTTTTQTTTFFSLPLWRRRAGPSMAASAMSEGPHAPTGHTRAMEDGRIARASSYNVDFNKKLPEVPHYDDDLDPAFARRSTGSMHFPNMAPHAESSKKGGRTTRASTLMPPQPQSTRTLAQAGLGIGLPYVMPLAASSTQRGSFSSMSRPSTAPRPTRLEPTKEVRRVRSFTREPSYPTSLTDMAQSPRARKTSDALAVPKTNKSGQEALKDTTNAPESQPETKSLMRRASFWNRRRVQSLKDPQEAQDPLNQDTQHIPLPALPSVQPVSPMFSDRPIHSSPGSTPRTPNFHQPTSGLRRRHSERSTSTHQSSPRDPSFSVEPPPPIPARSPRRPTVSATGSSSRPASTAGGLPIQEPSPRLVHMSFISSPAISRFPVVDERQPQPRPRAMTNPHNVLHRLSMGLFNSTSPSSPISSPTVSTNIADEIPFSASPRHSSTLPRSSLSKSSVEIPKPRADEESPEVFLGRLEEAVSKAEIANILAGSGDSFYIQALQSYIDRFDFTNDPLDIALRKLLMDVGLPKETQQIDRVMEAFAANYTKCNPDLFVSQDHPYILSFSLIMLHTDAFNKSNKRKMTKADYIKNTKLVGVSTEVLDYFFDNIVFAPFIFIEDPVDVNGQRGVTQDGRMQSSVSGQTTPGGTSSGLSILGKTNKVDAYLLITKKQLGHLRVDVESHIPLRNPYSYQGTAGSWNEAELRRSFARADVIEVDSLEARRMSTMPFFSMGVSGAPGPMVTSFPPPVLTEHESMLSEYSSLRITKVGLLNRKDDLLDGGKRASNRKWREWSIILTGSQLLFYRDSALALNLIIQAQSPESETFPAQNSFLRPDELLSVKDAVAVYDASYIKRDYVVRLVMPSGRQILLQTENEIQRNEWIAHINYASAFKTAGIRMRPVSPTEDARMDGSSYTDDAPQIPAEPSTPEPNVLDRDIANASSDALSTSSAPVIHTQSPSIEGTSNAQSRSGIVLSKIRDFESKVETARVQLDSDIRLVHNLAILTPFQRSTRDRLQASVINLGKHIKQLRLEIVKSTCFRDVLAADLASEERERRLRRREDSEITVRQRRERDTSVPTMTLSVHEDDHAREGSGQTMSRSDLSDLSHGHPESSICESFHSALDFGSDWPRNTRISTSIQRDTEPSRSFDGGSPLHTPSHEAPPGSSVGSSFFPSPSPAESTPVIQAPLSSSSSIGPDSSPVIEQRISEEQAEEWDKTRAARRVSLVKVPAGLKVTGKDARRYSSRSMKDSDDAKLFEEKGEHSDVSSFHGL